MYCVKVCAFNRTVEKVDKFLAKEAKGTKVIGAHSLEEMVSKLKLPRRIMMLVQAGKAVDDFIDKLVNFFFPRVSLMILNKFSTNFRSFCKPFNLRAPFGSTRYHGIATLLH